MDFNNKLNKLLIFWLIFVAETDNKLQILTDSDNKLNKLQDSQSPEDPDSPIINTEPQ